MQTTKETTMTNTPSNVVAFRAKRPRPALITRELVASLRPLPDAYVRRDTKLKGFMVRVQPSGVMTYRVEIGRGKQLKLGRTTDLKTSEARALAEQIFANVKRGHDPWDGIKDAPPSESTVPTLGAFIAGTDPDESDVLKWNGPYATEKKAKAGGVATRAYTENLKALKRLFGKWWELPLSDISPRMLNERKNQLLTEPRAVGPREGATVRRDLSRLQGVLRVARKNEYCDNRAFEKVELPEDSDAGVVRFLSPEERERLESALLLDATPDYLRVMVVVSLLTGLRRGELFKLTWPAIDFNKNVLTVYRATSKTKKRSRHIPLTPRARATLLKWKPKDASGLVFPNADGASFDNVKKSFATLLNEAEIENFRWHDLRHDYASRCAMAGRSLYEIMKHLGHTNIKTTERYAHLAPWDTDLSFLDKPKNDVS